MQFVSTDGLAPLSRQAGQQLKGRIAFGRAVRFADLRAYDQAMAILHHAVAEKRQLGFATTALFGVAAVGVGARFMRVVTA